MRRSLYVNVTLATMTILFLSSPRVWQTCMDIIHVTHVNLILRSVRGVEGNFFLSSSTYIWLRPQEKLISNHGHFLPLLAFAKIYMIHINLEWSPSSPSAICCCYPWYCLVLQLPGQYSSFHIFLIPAPRHDACTISAFLCIIFKGTWNSFRCSSTLDPWRAGENG